MVINSNITAQSAATELGKTSQLLAQSLARLSSGSKITSPSDDAAGLAVSMKFGAQISRTTAANDNVANATSFSQTQDGYLQQIGTALTRMSELTISAQDVTKTTSDRQIYNQEFQSLATYVNDVVTKDFNGVSLFSGNALNVTTDGDGGTFAMQGISANYLTSTTTTSTVGYAANTQLGQISSAFNSNPAGVLVGASSGFDATITPTNTINDLVNYFNDPHNIGYSSASYNASTGQLSLTVGAGGAIGDVGQMLSDLGFGSLTSLVPGEEDIDNHGGSSPLTASTSLTHNVTTTNPTGTLDLTSVQGAASALTSIKSSINQLASDRATVGSNLERLSYTGSQLTTLNNNLSAAKSQITDVDVAAESTNYARQNILMQAGTAMLAQANSLPQSVLKLLG